MYVCERERACARLRVYVERGCLRDVCVCVVNESVRACVCVGGWVGKRVRECVCDREGVRACACEIV